MGAQAPRMGGGFGGFTPNPSVPYPGGRVLSSDVQQASDAINFGGAVARPGPTMTPTPSPTPNIVMDPSGAGHVSSGLNGSTVANLPNDRYVADRTNGTNTTDDVAQGVPSRGGKSPTLITDPNEDWVGTEGGMRNAESGNANALPSGPGPGDGPALYEDPTKPPQEPSATITTAGGQPRETPRYAGSGNNVAGFGGNMSLGQFLSTPLSLMLFGGNRFQPTQTPAPVGRGTVSYADASYQTPSIEIDPSTGWSPSPEQAANADTNFAAAEAQGVKDDVKNGVAVSPDVRAALPVETGAIGSAPEDVRFAQNSGTGNWTADQTAKSFLGWNPADAVTNDNSTSDEGQTRFRTPMTRDAEGGFAPAGPTATAGPSASANLYQQALQAVPMGRGGFTAQYVQQLNDWIARQRPAGSG